MENLNQRIAMGFVERAGALGLKGKKRDDAALEYVIGAHRALEYTGQTKAAENLTALIFLVSIRGYSFLYECASENGGV